MLEEVDQEYLKDLILDDVYYLLWKAEVIIQGSVTAFCVKAS